MNMIMRDNSLLLGLILVIDLFIPAFTYEIVLASDEVIRIKIDGVVDGTDKIVKDGDRYYFIADIFGTIFVDCDHAVVDGAGYSLRYPNGERGLTLNGDYITIKGLIIKQVNGDSTTGIGVYLNESNNSNIMNNTIVENSIGVGVISSCSDIKISKNYISNNYHAGVQTSCNTTIIYGNYFLANGYGISLDQAGNVIWGNQIENNNVGVYCLALSIPDGVDDNIFFSNNFVNNTNQFLNWAMKVPPFKNILDDGSVGNYWSNYNGTDFDDNGIGDESFFADKNSQDKYPLMVPVDVSVIPEFHSSSLLLIFFLIAFTLVFVYKIRIRD